MIAASPGDRGEQQRLLLLAPVAAVAAQVGHRLGACPEPVPGIGLALKYLAPKSRPIGERYVRNYR